MRFTFEGKTYVIEFQRERREVRYYSRGIPQKTPSTKPYTTARIIEVDPTVKGKESRLGTLREWTVGCNVHDTFDAETGRKIALQKAMYDAPTKGGGVSLLGKGLTRDFRKTVWDSYFNRFPEQKVKEPEVTLEAKDREDILLRASDG